MEQNPLIAQNQLAYITLHYIRSKYNSDKQLGEQAFK